MLDLVVKRLEVVVVVVVFDPRLNHRYFCILNQVLTLISQHTRRIISICKSVRFQCKFANGSIFFARKLPPAIHKYSINKLQKYVPPHLTAFD